MLKRHEKKQTPQEIYKARKQREEEEKDAYLPPGLVNHGNTCFMNSTLQGLIATSLLHELIRDGRLPSPFHDIAGTSILSRRSPLLTNGRGMECKQDYVEGMTLGDHFIDTLQKAWDLQDARQRQGMSPKDLLYTIATKYDQYNDFQQQDAHEFLRHLLDAMRMEEIDVIKKRQPPPPKSKKKRKRKDDSEPYPIATNGAPAAETPTSVPEPSGEDKLVSFVDMLFGGRLASILVCEKCKKVSLTYEDFNDLSLSIKPEDYVKERKRDKFKNLAKKLRFKPGKDLELSAVSLQRSSSVPASPIRRSTDMAPPDEDPPVNEAPRRRSFDHVEGPKSSEEDGRVVPMGTPELPAAAPTSPSPVDDFEVVNAEPEEEKEYKSSPKVDFVDIDVRPKDSGGKKEKDPWTKLSRRISTSMNLAKSAKRLSRSKERRKTIDNIKEGYVTPGTPPLIPQKTIYESGSEFGDVSDVPRSRGISPSRGPIPLTTLPLNNSTSFPAPHQLPTEPEPPKISKSPRPPKPTREETAYLRQLLADVHPATPSAFTMLHQAISGASGTSTNPPITAHALLSKMGHLPGIEECLRMFTAVEIMDGDNMVGCHRCWKIANGTYKPRRQDPEDHLEDDDSSDPDSPVLVEHEPLPDVQNVTADSSASSSPELTHPSAASSPNHASTSSIFSNDAASVSSAPTTLQSAPSISRRPKPLPPPLNGVTPARKDTSPAQEGIYAGQPIPSISTTAPESPLAQTSFPLLNSQVVVADVLPDNRPSNDSLLTPKLKRGKFPKQSGMLDDSDSSGDSDFDDTASDRSGSVSAYSEASSLASQPTSPVVSPRGSTEKLPLQVNNTLHLQAGKKERSKSKRIPRSQQVIMRRTYKRYLIADPPPVLMIHLKRFQQISKSYAMSFSNGFKKLDDYVTFPEYLDLAPFLAPRKEDFGLGREKGKEKGKKKAVDGKKEERCMYRLYAVVVHIGNMLGGHYVAYTALPPANSRPSTSEDQPVPSSPSSSTDSSAALGCFETVQTMGVRQRY
ncbi:hypothetical protein QCA50_013308 [Cerrena zonata]|uniref:ubiquitinyl hydrolase 1 n=1 Tax=Cerrena zonata TaxID=2478898 RepID=A0AAW0FVQ8_9APHY